MAVGFEPTGTVSSHSVFDALGYAWGQCTAFVAESVSWLNGAQGLGNAKDWLTNAANQGYTIVKTPVVGAVAVFGGNTPGSGGEGHVGVVTSVTGSSFGLEEANVVGLDSVDNGQYTVSNPNLLGFILPKGDTSGAPVTAQLESAFGSGWNWGPLFGGTGGLTPGGSITSPITGVVGEAESALGGFILQVLIGVLGVVFVIVGLILIGKGGGQSISVTGPTAKSGKLSLPSIAAA